MKFKDPPPPTPQQKTIPFNQTIERALYEIKLLEVLWEIQPSKKLISYRHSTNRNVPIHI